MILGEGVFVRLKRYRNGLEDIKAMGHPEVTLTWGYFRVC